MPGEVRRGDFFSRRGGLAAMVVDDDFGLRDFSSNTFRFLCDKKIMRNEIGGGVMGAGAHAQFIW